MKKISAILLALVMMLSMVASAASITITVPALNEGSETGITYTAYKIFDATILNDTNYAYTIDSVNNPYWSTISAYSNLNTTENKTQTEYFKLTASAGDPTIYIVETTSAYTTSAADTFADVLKNVSATAAGFTNTATSNTISGLTDGYYLVTSSVGTDLILDTIGDITVSTKNEYPTIGKWVEQAGTTTTTADHDEVLNYGITVTIPADATGVIVVHDEMTNLEYQSMTAVEGITAATTCTDCSVTFTLSAEYVAAHKGTTITINYTAKFTGEATADNDAWLVDDTYTSKVVETTVYTTDVVINKVISGSTTPLAGAKFVLKNSDGAYYKVTDGSVTWYTLATDDASTSDVDESETLAEAIAAGKITVVTTTDTGVAEFENMADGTYYLVETEAPTGYNLLTDPVTVTVAHVSGEGDAAAVVTDITATVENSSGTELPSTGGMGTTIFYVVGGLMMAAAVVLLVSKKKVNA